MLVRFVMIISLLFNSVSLSAHAAVNRSQISGLKVITLFALTCAADSWQKFAKLAQQQRISDKVFDLHGARFNAKTEAVSFDNLNYSIKVNPDDKKNFIVLRTPSNEIGGADPCDLFVKVQTAEVKKSSVLNFFENPAWGADLIKESLATEYVMAGVFAGCIALGALTGGIGLSFIGVGVWGLVVSAQQISNIKEVENVINSPFKLTCTSDTVSIDGEKERLFLSKLPNGDPRVELAVLNSDQVILQDKDTQSAALSRKFIVELGKICKNKTDAARIGQQLDSQRKQVIARLESVIPNWTPNVDKATATQ